jgi:hypothetical protein
VSTWEDLAVSDIVEGIRSWVSGDGSTEVIGDGSWVMGDERPCSPITHHPSPMTCERSEPEDAETLGRAVLLLEALVRSERVDPGAAFNALRPRLYSRTSRVERRQPTSVLDARLRCSRLS